MELDESMKCMEAYFNAKFEDITILPNEDNSDGISPGTVMVLKSIDNEHLFVVCVSTDELVEFKFRIND